MTTRGRLAWMLILGLGLAAGFTMWEWSSAKGFQQQLLETGFGPCALPLDPGWVAAGDPSGGTPVGDLGILELHAPEAEGEAARLHLRRMDGADGQAETLVLTLADCGVGSGDGNVVRRVSFTGSTPEPPYLLSGVAAIETRSWLDAFVSDPEGIAPPASAAVLLRLPGEGLQGATMSFGAQAVEEMKRGMEER